MKKSLLILLCCFSYLLPSPLSEGAGVRLLAQNATTLYEQGKKLYDEEKYAEAFPKLKAAAEKGHKKAQYRLGRCYDKGKGVEEDNEQAFKWYKKAADQDYAKGLYQVGKCYKDGKGVPKDKKKAFTFFQKAANQQNSDAELALGKAYMKGKGTAADEAKAKKFLKRAFNNPKGGPELLKEVRDDAAAGDEDAKKILTLIK